MKRTTRLAKIVDKLPRHPSGTIHPLHVLAALESEHQAVKRKVMGMRNIDCKDKHYFYLLACDQILNWLEARWK